MAWISPYHFTYSRFAYERKSTRSPPLNTRLSFRLVTPDGRKLLKSPSEKRLSSIKYMWYTARSHLHGVQYKERYYDEYLHQS